MYNELIKICQSKNTPEEIVKKGYMIARQYQTASGKRHLEKSIEYFVEDNKHYITNKKTKNDE